MANEKNVQSAVVEHVKQLRQNCDISVQEMADAVGVSVEEYVAFESGKTDQSFTFLFKCANKLGVDISELVMGDDPKLQFYNVTHKGEGMPIKRRAGFDYIHIAPLLKNRISEPFVVTAKYSTKLEQEPISLSTHSGQELNYVLKGKLKVQLEESIEILEAGESVYYDATRRHGMIAIGGEDCVFLSVVIKGDNEDAVYNPAVTEQPYEFEQNELLYKKYMIEILDEKGRLKDVKFNYPETFNFGYDVVDELAKKDENKIAMRWVSKNHEKTDFTFSDISKLSNQAVNYFKSLGIKKDDKVMLVLKRHYQFWISIIALHKLGAVAIPATNLLTAKDFEYRFNKAQIKAVVATADGDVTNQIELCLESCPTVKHKMIANGTRDGWSNFDEEISKFSDKFERSMLDEEIYVTDPMLMYFTSGTTGYPKVAVHSSEYALSHIITARWWHNVDPNGFHFSIADTGWGKAAWGKLYGQWFCEAPVFTYDFDKFHADDILPMFKKYGITTFCAPPTMFRMFIKEDLSRFDLSSLKYAVVAGEALNPEVYEQFLKATGVKLMEGFGQTETTLTIANLVGMTPKPGSMGKPTPQYNVEILTPNGDKAKVGEVGEICIRVDSRPCGLFLGYYQDDEKTAECIKDGIYHTGDMAWCDEQGYFWFVGRTDDIIKSSGYRIGPFEIESVLMELPYVLECAVTGVPDEVRGAVVKATIILTKGTVGTDELKKEIQEYVKHKTAPYKYPRVVEFVSELPKTISGKIRRVEIRNQK